MAGWGGRERSSSEGFWNVPFKKARPSCGLGEAESGGGKRRCRNQAGGGNGVAPRVAGAGLVFSLGRCGFSCSRVGRWPWVGKDAAGLERPVGRLRLWCVCTLGLSGAPRTEGGRITPRPSREVSGGARGRCWGCSEEFPSDL